MVHNATFNNISVISWRVSFIGSGPWENHRPGASPWQSLSHNVVYHTITTASALTWCIIYIQIITKQTYINLALVKLAHFGYIRFYSKILKWSGIIIFLCQYNLFTPWYSWKTDNLGVKYQSITCTGSHSWLFCLDLLLCVLSKTFKLLCFLIFWLWAYLMMIIPETLRGHKVRYILINKRNATKIFFKYIFMLKPK